MTEKSSAPNFFGAAAKKEFFWKARSAARRGHPPTAGFPSAVQGRPHKVRHCCILVSRRILRVGFA